LRVAATTRRGRPPHPDVLTPTEWRIVDAVRHGLTNRQIAALRGVTLDAVKFHVENAAGKLGLSGRAALRAWRGVPRGSALRRGGRSTRKETRMSGNVQLGAIGQVARAVSDIAKAEAWYRDVLGLPHLYTFGALAFFDCGGTRLFLEEHKNIEVPNLHNESMLYFRVADIHAAHEALVARGVTFVGAPHMIFRHPDGTEEWMAFFNDPDGKPLALMSQVRA
jgi:catechol 2,3-dioxygenase-like lactoylglutathione lyase family enzyme/DNA-binding CsgD family transcriptional regulator